MQLSVLFSKSVVSFPDLWFVDCIFWWLISFLDKFNNWFLSLAQYQGILALNITHCNSWSPLDKRYSLLGLVHHWHILGVCSCSLACCLCPTLCIGLCRNGGQREEAETVLSSLSRKQLLSLNINVLCSQEHYTSSKYQRTFKLKVLTFNLRCGKV